MNFVLELMDFVLKMMSFVLKWWTLYYIDDSERRRSLQRSRLKRETKKRYKEEDWMWQQWKKRTPRIIHHNTCYRPPQPPIITSKCRPFICAPVETHLKNSEKERKGAKTTVKSSDKTVKNSQIHISSFSIQDSWFIMQNPWCSIQNTLLRICEEWDIFVRCRDL